jgi:small subunit ribosomal protein S18
MPRPMRRGSRERRGRGRYIPKRKVCIFCADKNLKIDYKDVQLLTRFVSDRARMDPRRKTGVCPRHQRTLSTALKRARYIALLPYTPEHVRLTGTLPTREHTRPYADRHPRPSPEKSPDQ